MRKARGKRTPEPRLPPVDFTDLIGRWYHIMWTVVSAGVKDDEEYGKSVIRYAVAGTTYKFLLVRVWEEHCVYHLQLLSEDGHTIVMYDPSSSPSGSGLVGFLNGTANYVRLLTPDHSLQGGLLFMWDRSYPKGQL